MHEMGIALEIVDIVNASVPDGMDPSVVEKIHLQVGRLSAVVPGSLLFCFDVATRDTALADAVLVIEEIDVQARCDDCGHCWTVAEPVFTCEACRSPSVAIVSGRQLDVRSIEIRDEEDDHAL